MTASTRRSCVGKPGINVAILVWLVLHHLYKTRLTKLARTSTSSLTRRILKLLYHVVQGQEAPYLRFISFHLFVYSSKTQQLWHISSIGRGMHCLGRIVCSSSSYARVVIWFIHGAKGKEQEDRCWYFYRPQTSQVRTKLISPENKIVQPNTKSITHKNCMHMRAAAAHDAHPSASPFCFRSSSCLRLPYF